MYRTTIVGSALKCSYGARWRSWRATNMLHLFLFMLSMLAAIVIGSIILGFGVDVVAKWLLPLLILILLKGDKP